MNVWLDANRWPSVHKTCRNLKMVLKSSWHTLNLHLSCASLKKSSFSTRFVGLSVIQVWILPSYSVLKNASVRVLYFSWFCTFNESGFRNSWWWHFQWRSPFFLVKYQKLPFKVNAVYVRRSSPHRVRISSKVNISLYWALKRGLWVNEYAFIIGENVR